jgi:cell division septation protein DedD
MARRNRSKRDEQAPGWLWMLFGLGLGLVVALGVYLRGAQRSEPSRFESAAVEHAVPPQPARAGGEADDAAETRFDFYEILPQFEVVVPEVETPAGRDAPARAVEEPGSYILQAGSFTSLSDADRLQANLALLGIESRIQRVTIDDDVFHRVRVGPISDLTELNRVRARLRQARIEHLLVKVPD